MRPVWTFSVFSLQSYSCFCERSFFLKVWWGEGEQTADQVSVDFINLWTSNTTGLLEKSNLHNWQTSNLHKWQTFWSRKWGPWRLCKWPGRAEKSFYWTKYMKQGYFAKKNWLKLVIFSRNGDSKILPGLYGVATACCISLQISKLQIWKKYSREICY